VRLCNYLIAHIMSCFHLCELKGVVATVATVPLVIDLITICSIERNEPHAREQGEEARGKVGSARPSQAGWGCDTVRLGLGLTVRYSATLGRRCIRL